MKKYVDIQQTKYGSIKLGYLEDDKWSYSESPVDWWFGIKQTDYSKVSDLLQSYKMEKWNEYLKVYCNPKDDVIRQLIYDREIETFEDDLDLKQRFWLDHPELHTSDYYRTAYFDIEVMDKKYGLDIGRGKITSVAIKDKKAGDETFLCVHPTIGNCKNEKELLIRFINCIRQYDLISGWNSKGYDMPYIRKRINEHVYSKKNAIRDGKKVKIIDYDHVRDWDLLKASSSTFKRISHIDLMHRMIHAYRFDTHIRSFSLDSIAKKFLGKGKLLDHVKLFDVFDNNPEKFKEYNLEDVRLLHELDKQNNILDMVITQSAWCNVFLKDVGVKGRGLYKMLDTIILQTAHNRGILGPTPIFDADYSFGGMWKSDDPNMKKGVENIKTITTTGGTKVKLKKHRTTINLTGEELEATKYPGGYVFDPIPGLHKHIYTFDFKSLYPTAICSFNIGFNTLLKHPLDISGEVIKNPADTYFIKNIKSVQAEVLEYLMSKRVEYKKAILSYIEKNDTKSVGYEKTRSDEIVVKELSNSLYGITGKRDGRYFSKDIASSITLACQWICKSLKRYAELEGFRFLYGDTDSGMIEVPTVFDSDDFLKGYHKWLAIELKNEWNIDDSIIELEPDKYYSKYLLLNKKVYSGRVLKQEGKKCDNIYSRGLDFIKSSVCGIAAKTQKELVESLLMEEHDVKYYQNWIIKKRDTIFKNIKKEDLSLHQKISKKFNEYKNKTLAVYLAEDKSKREGAMMIRDIDYIITGDLITEETVQDKKTGKDKVVKRKRQAGVETVFYKRGEFSKEYYWNKATLNVLNRVLKVVFPEVEWSKDYKI